ELLVEPLRTDRLLLVAPPNHHFARVGRVSRADLRGQPFIAREPGSGTRALAESALGPVAEDIRTVVELDQPEAIARAVEAGMGLAFISETIVARHLADGLLVALDFPEASLEREFSLVSLRGRFWTPAMRLFAAYLRQQWKGTGT
ncbi:MAG TPA: LysR substrate-binding domain-containing protein, partial [Chloroflexota bacterium]|nr:LysR substrate-binding domain-containing protein [Chloroflexota bacterium]